MSHDTSTQNEQWLDIPGYEGYYQVSSMGRVKTLHRVTIRNNGWPITVREKIRKLFLDKRGYWRVSLRKPGQNTHHLVHRLVLEAFVGPCPEGMEACHNDGDPGNAKLSNLRWDSSSSNNFDIVKHGNHFAKNKTHCPQGHLLASFNVVASYARRGHRKCLSCARARAHIQRNPHLSEHLQKVSDTYFESLEPSLQIPDQIKDDL